MSEADPLMPPPGSSRVPSPGSSRAAGPVLVTGATGAIGRRLVAALLDAGAQVAVLTRSAQRVRDLDWADRVICREGDLTLPATLEAACSGIETLFHLASYNPGPSEPDSYESPRHWAVTVEGTQSLIAAAVAAGVSRIVYLSSIKAMGDLAGAGGVPADETSPPQPACLYGRAKLRAEQALHEAAARHGLHVCVLRLPMVYGLGAQGNIARLIQAIARGRFPPWPRVANRRSAIHVEDVVAATRLVAEDPRARGQTYLVTDGRAYSTRWLYEQICAALGRRPPAWTVPLWLLRAAAAVGTRLEGATGRAMPLTRTGLDKLTGDAWFSSEKIARELGYRPAFSLETEIPRLVDDYLRRVHGSTALAAAGRVPPE